MLPCLIIKFSVSKIEFSVCFRNLSYHSTRVSCRNHPFRNVSCHNASCPDHRVAANMYARTYHGIAADPYIVTDRHFNPVFVCRIAGIRMSRMACRIDRNIWRQLTVITDHYLRNIQNRTIIICEKILPYFYMRT